MIVLPRLDEVQGADWAPEGDPGGSFLTGAAAALPLGTFRLPSDPHLLAPAVPDDDPVVRADTLRGRAGQMFGRHRAIGHRSPERRALIETKPRRFQRANPQKCALDILALQLRRAMRHLDRRRTR
jgi:hypothetical protein